MLCTNYSIIHNSIGFFPSFFSTFSDSPTAAMRILFFLASRDLTFMQHPFFSDTSTPTNSSFLFEESFDRQQLVAHVVVKLAHQGRVLLFCFGQRLGGRILVICFEHRLSGLGIDGDSTA